jgi:hypothetical protein
LVDLHQHHRVDSGSAACKCLMAWPIPDNLML